MEILNRKNQNYGFTLIEVLVAATIIGLLSTIGITGFQAITRSGRDALRKSDLEQIRSALEIYKSENKVYPVDDSSCNLNGTGLVPDYISPYPVDPKSPTQRYCYDQTGNLTYNLCAHLENGNANDYDCGISGNSNDCGSNCNYMVSNP